MTFLAFLSLALLISLGFWQLRRAEEKNLLLKNSSKQALEPIKQWQEGMPLPKQFEAKWLEGQYLPYTFLLDNQHVEHQFAFSILSPLQLGEKVVLIDRGFVKADITRQHLPKINTPKEKLKLKGSVYYPSKKGFVLGESYERKGDNLYIIEKIDTELIAQFLHKSVYPFIIRLDKNEQAGFIREWAIVSMPPERHYAYALQWFAMAFVVVILYIGLNLKKKS